MQSIELTKPLTTESLLREFESRFNQTMDLSKFTKEDLEDYANKVRTKIHEITQNTHFGKELNNDSYQKSQMMLDVLNQAIKEAEDQGNPIVAKILDPIKAKVKQQGAEALSSDEKDVYIKNMSKMKRYLKKLYKQEH